MLSEKPTTIVLGKPAELVLHKDAAKQQLQEKGAALVTCKIISADELAALKSEHAGNKLIEMKEDDSFDDLLEAWMQIKLMTGAIVYEKPKPGEPDLLGAQLESLHRFMLHGPFAQLTKAEVILAFNMNCAGINWESVQHYNRPLDCAFVGAVLRNYRDFKNRMYTRAHYDIVKALRDQPKAIAAPALDLRPIIAADYDHYMAGHLEEIYGCSEKYFYLRRNRYMPTVTAAMWVKWYYKAVAYLERKAERLVGQEWTKRERLSLYQHLQKEGTIKVAEHLHICHTARRLLYLRFFEILKAHGIPELHSPGPWGDYSYAKKANQ